MMTVSEPVAQPGAATAANMPSIPGLVRSSRLEAVEFPDRASFRSWAEGPPGCEQNWRRVIGTTARSVVLAELPDGRVFGYYRAARRRKNRRLRPPVFLTRQSAPIRLHVGGGVPAPVAAGEPARPGAPVLMPGSPSLDAAPVLRPWTRALIHHVAAALNGFPPAPLPDLRTLGEAPVGDELRRDFSQAVPWEAILSALELEEVLRVGQTRFWIWPYGRPACATTALGQIEWVHPLSWNLRVRLRCEGCDKYGAFARLLAGSRHWPVPRVAQAWLAGLAPAHEPTGFGRSADEGESIADSSGQVPGERLGARRAQGGGHVQPRQGATR